MELVRNSEGSQNLSDSPFSTRIGSMRNDVRLQFQVILPNTAFCELKNTLTLCYCILHLYERAKLPK